MSRSSRRWCARGCMVAGVVAAATAIACAGPSASTGNSGVTLKAANFELLPLARNCPATTPVTIGGPGLPATYQLGYTVTIQNGTTDTVRIISIGTVGSVVAATNNVGVNRSAHVFGSVPYAPNEPIPPGTDATIGGFFTVLCGDNPIITQSAFWDIATALNIATTKDDFGTQMVTFRRNWTPCGPGHPCPASQPPLPNN